MSLLNDIANGPTGKTPDHPEWPGTDKADWCHDYFPAYERVIGGLRDLPIKLLEIGVCGGGGLKVWASWAPLAIITGIENDPTNVYNEPPRITTVCCDVKEYDPDRLFDVIIDDGSHCAEDINPAFHRLFPSLRPGGLYFIEDVRQDVKAELDFHYEVLGVSRNAGEELGMVVKS